MTGRVAKPLPPPTEKERETARVAAAALRLAIANPDTMGKEGHAHIDFARPRRGVWITSWANLPGFQRWRCSRDSIVYSHTSLPGWQYQRHEIKTELIPDLEALAERGERPTEATR